MACGDQHWTLNFLTLPCAFCCKNRNHLFALHPHLNPLQKYQYNEMKKNNPTHIKKETEQMRSDNVKCMRNVLTWYWSVIVLTNVKQKKHGVTKSVASPSLAARYASRASRTARHRSVATVLDFTSDQQSDTHTHTNKDCFKGQNWFHIKLEPNWNTQHIKNAFGLNLL